MIMAAGNRIGPGGPAGPAFAILACAPEACAVQPIGSAIAAMRGSPAGPGRAR